MITIDGPSTLGKFRQINTWRRLTLARLKGLRDGLLQTSRETGAALDLSINEAFVRLQYAIDREWERRKTAVRHEAAQPSRLFGRLPDDGPPPEQASPGRVRRSAGGATR